MHENLLSAIVESEWCEYDPYALRPHEALAGGWERFREYVKHERRYTLLMARDDRTLGAGPERPGARRAPISWPPVRARRR